MSRPVSPRDRATAAQLEASNPHSSAFVSASAGSGKTRVLINRLLRLMLGDATLPGTAPERILCLTYTRAAAAEMSLRLQQQLGAWIGLDDAKLDADLHRLGLVPDDDLRRRARRLFAQVLDVPGGMRIGTIHAFCQSLLRRFPLEASLTPHFRLVEDRDADSLLHESQEDVLNEAVTGPAQQALQTLVGLVKADDFAALVRALLAAHNKLNTALHATGSVAALQATQYRVLGLEQGVTEESVLAKACSGFLGERDLRAAAVVMAEHGGAAVQSAAAQMLAWLNLAPAERALKWGEWRRVFLTQKGEIKAEKTLTSKNARAVAPDLYATLEAEGERIIDMDGRLSAIAVAQASAALIALAAPVLDGYATRKADSGALDYADIISAAAKLLHDPGAAFVLYKLDGGLDHVLLDEAQDTAPEQWHLTAALTHEFFAGHSAQEQNRTIFVVGDRKQSIYSFQGADPSGFDAWRERLRTRTRGVAEREWCEPELDVSFRSTEPVLRLTDAVFSDPDASAGVVPNGATLEHLADRAGHAGRVELWPLMQRPERPDTASWSIPASNLNTESAPQALANKLADWIAQQLADATPLESRGRPLQAGDILVLVRRRNAFATALVRALKARGVPVAGLDRMKLPEQLAVKDLLALADTLLLPEDDLALATVLTSPLGNISDDGLMHLALGRTTSLWHTLQRRAGEREDWKAAHDFIAALRARTDYVSPHVLFTEALGPLGGRARLQARLGPEAAEPVDEFLNIALNYARMETPSLQGFVHMLRSSAAEVKREAEAAGDVVRIMTVHGAKGLQAPLVILPDTTALPKFDTKLLWLHDNATGAEIPLWSPASDMVPGAVIGAQTRIRAAALEEYNRLLYVALTRAEDRLVVCGWASGNSKTGSADVSWYNLVRRGFEKLGATQVEDTLVISTPQTRAPDVAAALLAPVIAPPLPHWAGSAPDWRAAPPPAEPLLPRPLAPSRPEGVQHGAPPAAAAPLAARDPHGARFARGLLVHTLLQHLPDVPHAQRHAAALRYLGDEAQAEQLAQEVLGVLDHPELGALFGPDSRAEVPLTGVVGDQVIGGLMDRIAILPDRILLADFKTNRDPPEQAADAPVAYLRQMAAYRAVLRGVFPDRAITCALIWTRAARVMALPDILLDRHAPA